MKRTTAQNLTDTARKLGQQRRMQKVERSGVARHRPIDVATQEGAVAPRREVVSDGGYVRERRVVAEREAWDADDPRGQASQDDHDHGHRDELRPRGLDARQNSAQKKEEEEGHGSYGTDQWIQHHDLFGNRRDGFGNGFDGRDDRARDRE